MNAPLSILGIAGSLRKASFNRAALRAAQKLAPEGSAVSIFELEGIPPFNQDEEIHLPERVRQFKEAIRAADAILVVTPEYNYSVPGVLKNAIDWASRPYGDNAWDGKPAAIMGASPGLLGTVRAQNHLRQICVNMNLLLLNRPEVVIAQAGEKFDAEGNLTDEKTAQSIRALLEALVTWTLQLRRGHQPT